MTTSPSAASLEKIVSLCKRRGLLFPSAEIYGGLTGVYDVGPLGVALKNNIKTAWSSSLKNLDLDIFFFDGALLGPQPLWVASGHVENFHDPMVDCLVCKHRYRADELDLAKPCPHCGNTKWTDVRQFNMMFQTAVGASAGSIGYLRPETAQAIFVNFKNIATSYRAKVPFGVAQLGKAFRNEITPKQFLFRMREFEQMELEWFCAPTRAMEFFEFWCKERVSFYQKIGIPAEKIHLRAHEKSELSHYSQATSDIEFDFPFGRKELEGIAYRGDFDLRQHSAHSGKDLSYFDEATKSSFIPHVVECSVGTDRLLLALLCAAYTEDILEGEVRTRLSLHPEIAPIAAAVFPLMKQQKEQAQHLFKKIRNAGYAVQFDESGSIGKRYRRQDEIGTPFCFTYDFESETTQSVTVRFRDSAQQERISLDRILDFLADKICKR